MKETDQPVEQLKSCSKGNVCSTGEEYTQNYEIYTPGMNVGFYLVARIQRLQPVLKFSG